MAALYEYFRKCSAHNKGCSTLGSGALISGGLTSTSERASKSRKFIIIIPGYWTPIPYSISMSSSALGSGHINSGTCTHQCIANNVENLNVMCTINKRQCYLWGSIWRVSDPRKRRKWLQSGYSRHVNYSRVQQLPPPECVCVCR